MRSGIQTRLLVTTTLVLGVSLTLAGLALDRSVRLSTLSGAEEQLRLVIYSLMGALETSGSALTIPDPLPEPRLGQPESGLYAWVTDGAGALRWRSPSAVTGGVAGPVGSGDLQPGEFRFSGQPAERDGLLRLSYAVIWEDSGERVLIFHVAADWTPFRATIVSFRRNLYVGVGAVTALFVLAQILAIRWGLRPLRTMAQEVRDMEEGRRQRLSDAYPAELTGLAGNLDRFVAHEERSRSRYRKAMEDLAHSLKTPLAVVRNALDQVPGDARQLLEEQLDRMQSTVTHQLSRASVAGPVIVGRPVDVAALVDRLLRALSTAYHDRGIQVTVDLPRPCRVRGDERDLMEILGNLLENAFKYTRCRVRVSGALDGTLTLRVEDDGPGIPAEVRRAVLDRGTRADEVQAGHGIGLSVVAELVALYHGSLRIEESPLGGACLTLELPGAVRAPA
ncbi:MAG: ATP-binding protein [Gammaproteobacteria bacterium]|nr:ATP-binding protein [Gammaproteobacteria bacterium]